MSSDFDDVLGSALDDFGIGPDEGFGGLEGEEPGFGADDDPMGQMYQEFILEQARAPHGKAHFEDPDASVAAGPAGSTGNDRATASSAVLRQEHEFCLAQSHQFNPTCGDEVIVRVRLDWNHRPQTDPLISKIEWDGHGCAISQASLSVMHDLGEGHGVSDFLRRHAEFRALMDSRGQGISDPHAKEDLGGALAFQGASRFPMRIKCALLGWEGVRDAVARAMGAGASGDAPTDASGDSAQADSSTAGAKA